MAGVNNNLIPGDRRSHENNQANGRKGGIASGEAKKKKKARRYEGGEQIRSRFPAESRC